MKFMARATCIISGVTGLLFLTACGGGGQASLKPDESAHARLDYKSSIIIMPISEYRLSPDDLKVIDIARETAFGSCMLPKGFTTDIPKLPAISEDRFYGLWNVERARQYGFDIPGLNEASNSIPDDKGWQDARSQCIELEKSTIDTFTPPDQASNPTVADKIYNQSYAYAHGDKQWDEYTEEWRSCVRGKGLEPVSEDTNWTTQQTVDLVSGEDHANPTSAYKEEEIRLATLEAQCNEDTRLTQRLGDLQAGYQSALIKQNQAALNELKVDNQKYLKTAHEYIASQQ